MKQEIELKEGMTAKVEGGKLVIEMPEKYTPKKGEFVTCDRNTIGNKWIMIWGGVSPSGIFTSEAVAYNEILGLTVVGYSCRIDDNFRPSTPEEIDILLSAMRKQGKQWNAEAKRVEPLRYAPKDGDFVTLDEKWVSIYSGKGDTDTTIADYYGAGLPGSGLNHSGSSGARLRAIHVSLRPSTQAEKGLLLDVLKKKGLTWNAEKRAIEKLRWRAEPGDIYEYVDLFDGKIDTVQKAEMSTPLDDSRFNLGNYFKPGSGDIEKAADKINEIFKSHE